MFSESSPTSDTTIEEAYQLLPGSKSATTRKKSSPHLLAAAFLVLFLITSIYWLHTHPSYFEDINKAKELSFSTHLTIRTHTIPYDGPSTQQAPVPKIDTTIIGASAPNLDSISISLPTYPRHVQLGPSAPNADELLFAIATNADRAISQAKYWLWPAFLTNPQSPCFVLLAPKEAHLAEKVATELSEQGISCKVGASPLKVYQRRVMSLPMEVTRAFGPEMGRIKWLVMGDDDTLWLDKRGLQRMLGQHNHNEMKFIASTSECKRSLGYFGRMAFGGGGLIMSKSLVQKYVEILPDCEKRWPHTFGGDEVVNNCAALAQGFDNREDAYINEPGLHQLDIPGLASGFLEAGLPMITLHHFFSWSTVMPSWMHNDDDYRMLHVLLQAAKFLGQDNLFKRYSFDSGRMILANGYSITTYLVPLTASELEKMEQTWGFGLDSNLTFEVRPPITTIGHKQQPTDQQGEQRKSAYYLQAVENVNGPAGYATFVYRNEQGQEIVVDWIDPIPWWEHRTNA